MSTMTLKAAEKLIGDLVGNFDQDGAHMEAWDVVLARLTSREAKGRVLIGYIHPSWLDCGALAMEVSPVRLSNAQVPVYIHPTQEAAKPAKCGCAGELHFGCRRDTAEPIVPAGCTLIDDMELALLREKASVCVDAYRGDLWYWQGDGYDVPESMSCPVVMSAETLRSLITAHSNPEQAVGDGVKVTAFDGGWMFDTHRLSLTVWDVEHDPDGDVATVVLRECAKILSAPRLAVATPAEVADEAVERAAKGMWDLVPRGVEWPGLTKHIADDWRRLARAALAAQPSAVGVPEVVTIDDARKRGYKDNARVWVAGWNDCRFAMLAAAMEPPHDHDD